MILERRKKNVITICVLESLSFSDDNKKNSYKFKVDSFKFSHSRDKPSEFEINYIDKKGKKELYYNYGFKIDKKGKKVRKDSNYEKHYLLGNYGAIPNLKNLLGRE